MVDIDIVTFYKNEYLLDTVTKILPAFTLLFNLTVFSQALTFDVVIFFTSS